MDELTKPDEIAELFDGIAEDAVAAQKVIDQSKGNAKKSDMRRYLQSILSNASELQARLN